MTTKDTADLLISPARNRVIVRKEARPGSVLAEGDTFVFNHMANLFAFIAEHFEESGD